MMDFATLAVDEKTYTLRFPLAYLRLADRTMKRPLHQIFSPEDGKLPDYRIDELVLLFRIGLKADQPTLTEKDADDILSDFLSEGESMLQQALTLYLLLGKAMGFFRKDLNVQEEMEKRVKNKKAAQ